MAYSLRSRSPADSTTGHGGPSILREFFPWGGAYGGSGSAFTAEAGTVRGHFQAPARQLTSQAFGRVVPARRTRPDDALKRSVRNEPAMQTYTHRQRAGRWLAIPASVAIALALTSLFSSLKAIAWGIPFLFFMMWLLGSLTVTVTQGELQWRFGPGWIRFRVPLSEIRHARVVCTTWSDGWGIHGTEFGTLYNVSGFGAVAVELRSGRRFALGTDEADQLLGALQKAGVVV